MERMSKQGPRAVYGVGAALLCVVEAPNAANGEGRGLVQDDFATLDSGRPRPQEPSRKERR